MMSTTGIHQLLLVSCWSSGQVKQYLRADCFLSSSHYKYHLWVKCRNTLIQQSVFVKCCFCSKHLLYCVWCHVLLYRNKWTKRCVHNTTWSHEDYQLNSSSTFLYQSPTLLLTQTNILRLVPPPHTHTTCTITCLLSRIVPVQLVVWSFVTLLIYNLMTASLFFCPLYFM